MATLLNVEGLTGYYGHSQVLWGVSFKVEEGEVTAVVGSNGAGKTTLLRALSGLLPSGPGRLNSAGQRIDGLPPHRIVSTWLEPDPGGRGGLSLHDASTKTSRWGPFCPPIGRDFRRISTSSFVSFPT